MISYSEVSIQQHMLLNCHANEHDDFSLETKIGKQYLLGNRNVFHLNFECKRSTYPNRNNYCFHLISKLYEKIVATIRINETNIPGANIYLCCVRWLQFSRP